MTVCIAASCEEDDSVIAICDRMISTSDMSADYAALKIRTIAKQWSCMYAGNDISAVTPILDSITLGKDPETLEEVTSLFVDAFAKALRLQAEVEVLRPLGYTLDTFKKRGLKELGAEVFSRCIYEIQRQEIDVQFLVFGFVEEFAHIFTVVSPGKVAHFSELGFWSIGSGQTNALGTLFNLKNPFRRCNKPDMLYRLCEAKFNAETALGVGLGTTGMILYPNGNREVLGYPDIDKMRIHWEATRTISVPPAAHQAAHDVLGSASKDPLVYGTARARIRQAKRLASQKSKSEK